VISYGENRYNNGGIFPTVHAEDDAINKLPVLRRNRRRLKKIDLLVIRANQGGTVGNSKPCEKCLGDLYRKLPKKGYVLDTVHYTDKGEILVSKKFTKLLYDENKHVSKYFSKISDA
jgi:hypothetical protein